MRFRLAFAAASGLPKSCAKSVITESDGGSENEKCVELNLVTGHRISAINAAADLSKSVIYPRTG